MLRISVVIALSLISTAALAADTWTDPFPGVRRLVRTQSNPNWRIHAVEVDLCAEGVSLRATKAAEKQRTPSSFGQLVGAEVVVNGDFFSFSNYNPIGFAVGDGNRWSGDPATHNWVGFGPGEAGISGGGVDEPPWVEDAVGGNVMVLSGGTVTGDTGSFCTTRHPRTVAGLSQDRQTLILAVVDGRQTASVGMTCAELGTLMKGLGAHNALNLDGGGSTAMWMRGAGVVNSPSGGSQRVVSNHLAVMAKGTGEPEACNLYEAEIAAQFFGLDDFYKEGSSEGVPDVLVGDEFQGALSLTSKTPRRWRGTKLDWWFETPYLSATNYEIQTDHPVYDQNSWMTNDANDNPDNPPHESMGATGSLNMHAYTRNETKRVLLDLRANAYSIGAADHPDIRTWLHHIDGVYGEQTDFFGEPTNANRMGVNLRAHAELDVLSPYEWQFEDGGAEGWTECTDGSSPPVVAGALTLVECASAPMWTSVDAATYDQAVVKLAAPGAVSVGIGPDLLEFEGLAAGNNVLDLSSSSSWTGTVTSFTVQGSLAIDGLWFQSSATSISSSAAESFDSKPAVTPTSTHENPNPTEPGTTNNADGPTEPGEGTTTGGEDNGTNGADEPGAAVRGEGGCSTAPTRAPAATIVLLLGVCLAVRRKNHRR